MAVDLVASGGKGITGLMFDVDGKLFVCGGADGKLYLASGPALVETANLSSSPQSLAADGDGQIYACDAATASVVSIRADGTAAPLLEDFEGTQFKGPHTVIFDSSNQMYFTDPGSYGETSIVNPKGSVFLVTGNGDDRSLRPIALDSLAYPSGLALSPSETVLYVCEQSANRIIRFTQRPTGVYHASVFHQFAGRLGPSSIVCDHSRGGLLYVARPESSDVSERGLISILSPEGALLREFDVPGPELSSLAISPDGKFLYFAESTSNSIYRVLL